VASLPFASGICAILDFLEFMSTTPHSSDTEKDDDDFTMGEMFWAISAGISMPFIVLAWMYFLVKTIFLFPCFASRRETWDVRSQHLAVTRDGIRFDKDKRRTCCGLSCTDAGQTRITIQFDQITDCYIVEPVGSYLGCVPHTLTRVHVAVAARSDAANGQGNHVSSQIAFPGLKEPRDFRNLVMAMKRQRQTQPRENSLSSLVALLEQSGSDSNRGATEEIAVMLREIRNDLQASRTSHSDATAGNA